MSTAAAQGASAPAPKLFDVSDHLSEALSLIEAVYMAAGSLNVVTDRDAIRSVLHHVTLLVTGARDDVDAFGTSMVAVAA
jgi:hypothetical protein